MTERPSIRRWPARLAGLAAVAAAACAPLEPAMSPEMPTAALPLSAAGVVDGRAEFAKLLAAELRNAPPDSRVSGEARAIDRWLVAAPAATTADPGTAPDAVESAGRRFAMRAPSTVVLVVPGLFGDCVAAQSVPFGDGRLRTPHRSLTEAYAQYADLGLKEVRLVPLPGRASAEDNGRRLADTLRAEATRPGVQRIVLVAYSKGTTDALHALQLLQQSGALPPTLRALVSVSGIVRGTPLADRFAGVYEALSPLFDPLDCTPSSGGDVSSLTRARRQAWLEAHPPPAGLAYYSVVARASRSDIPWPLRLPYGVLESISPHNDGQVLASDAVLPGSELWAELRSDHWSLALPLDRHPKAWMRSLTTDIGFPREALFRAMVKAAVAGPAP
jgi:hypothetical protein